MRVSLFFGHWQFIFGALGIFLDGKYRDLLRSVTTGRSFELLVDAHKFGSR